MTITYESGEGNVPKGKIAIPKNLITKGEEVLDELVAKQELYDQFNVINKHDSMESIRNEFYQKFQLYFDNIEQLEAFNFEIGYELQDKSKLKKIVCTINLHQTRLFYNTGEGKKDKWIKSVKEAVDFIPELETPVFCKYQFWRPINESYCGEKKIGTSVLTSFWSKEISHIFANSFNMNKKPDFKIYNKNDLGIIHADDRVIITTKELMEKSLPNVRFNSINQYLEDLETELQTRIKSQ